MNNRFTFRPVQPKDAFKVTLGSYDETAVRFALSGQVFLDK